MTVEIGQAVMVDGELSYVLAPERACGCGSPAWLVATDKGQDAIFCEKSFGPAEGAEPMSSGAVFSSIVAIALDRAASATGLDAGKQVAVLAGLLGRVIGLKVPGPDVSWVCDAAHSIMAMSATKTSAAKRGDLAPGGSA